MPASARGQGRPRPRCLWSVRLRPRSGRIAADRAIEARGWRQAPREAGTPQRPASVRSRTGAMAAIGCKPLPLAAGRLAGRRRSPDPDQATRSALALHLSRRHPCRCALRLREALRRPHRRGRGGCRPTRHRRIEGDRLQGVDQVHGAGWSGGLGAGQLVRAPPGRVADGARFFRAGVLRPQGDRFRLILGESGFVRVEDAPGGAGLAPRCRSGAGGMTCGRGTRPGPGPAPMIAPQSRRPRPVCCKIVQGAGSRGVLRAGPMSQLDRLS